MRVECEIELELEGSLLLASLRLGVRSSLRLWREILLAPWRELLLGNASDLMKEPQLLMQRFNLSGESHDQPDTVEINAAGRTEVLNLA